jgi:hypothetical protein
VFFFLKFVLRMFTYTKWIHYHTVITNPSLHVRLKLCIWASSPPLFLILNIKHSDMLCLRACHKLFFCLQID